MKISRELALQKFDALLRNRTDFIVTAGIVLACLAEDNGVDAVIANHRWYAQICEAIKEGKSDTVTDYERFEFVKMHMKFVADINSTVVQGKQIKL